MTQKGTILARLRSRPQSTADLVRIACQYNARIYELRRDGHNIVADLRVTPGGKRYAIYSLMPEKSDE